MSDFGLTWVLIAEIDFFACILSVKKIGCHFFPPKLGYFWCRISQQVRFFEINNICAISDKYYLILTIF